MAKSSDDLLTDHLLGNLIGTSGDLNRFHFTRYLAASGKAGIICNQ